MARLSEHDAAEVVAVSSRDFDLTREDDVRRLFDDARPQIVFHLAGLVGGIQPNKERPAEFFLANLLMGTYVLHHAWRVRTEAFGALGAGCGYPEFAPVPLNERSFWDGLPQKESAAYSLAKRLLHVQSWSYYQQYDFRSVICVPGNIYGPHDNFDLHDSHVIPALVRKFAEAAEEGAPRVEVWGDGSSTRDFVYVGDVVDGLLRAVEVYDRAELVNISSGVETSIRDAVESLRRLTPYRGEIVWDTSRPNGQARRVFDVSKATADLGFTARVTLDEGLRRTLEWYRANVGSAEVRR
jgi:GDP-L-fucose synthase